MADIFVSYKKEDRDRVGPIVEALRGEGLNVWWDQDIVTGQPWDETIAARLGGARCVIVVWSTLSVTAPWVKEEAGAGKARGILVPARIHDVEPPLGFGLIQAADLRFWKGDRAAREWTEFVAAIGKVLRGETISLLDAPPSGRARRPLWIGAALGAVAIAAIAVAAYTQFSPRPATPPASQPQVAAPQSAPAPVIAEPSAAEQAAWADALKAKSRKAYDAYLAAFPEGRFAPDARAGLASCRTIEDVRYEPFEERTSATGTSMATSSAAREDALLSARDRGRVFAEQRCAAIAEAAGVEDVRTRLEPTIGPPQCSTLSPTATTCTQQFWVTCSGQKPIKSPREICG